MFGIGGVVVVAAIAGVIVGIALKGRWRDNGFMRTAEGQLIHWRPSESLTIWYRSDLSAEYVRALGAATRLLNGIVGRDLFSEIVPAPKTFRFDMNPPAGAGMIAICDDNGDDPTHGSTELADDAGVIQWAKMTLPENARSDQIPGIVLHELCHALGLDHDESVQSIMYYRLQDRPQELSQADRDLLRGYYAA